MASDASVRRRGPRASSRRLPSRMSRRCAVCHVNVFTSHVNVGFFQGAALPDPRRILQGNGRFMRHVKLRPGDILDEDALLKLIDLAFADMKDRVENG